MTISIDRVLETVTRAPAEFGTGRARIYVALKAAILVGAVNHMILLPLFWMIGQDVLAAFNVISVGIWVAAFEVLRRKRLITVIVMASAEGLLHAILATVYTGLETGFFFFALALVICVSILTNLGRKGILVLQAIGSLVFVGLLAYGFFTAPLQALPSSWAFAFLMYNSLVLITLLIMVLMTFLGATYRAEAALAAEHEKSERLLHNIIPVEVAERLKENPEAIADHHRAVTILFADIVDFTRLSGDVTPVALVAMLNDVFSRFDALVEREGLEKIKTIGDAYMVVAGLPEARDDHAPAIARLALGMLDETRGYSEANGKPLRLRIGVHSGEVVAGVIGQKKFAYDLWGDTVNVAARMESHGVPGRIQISAETEALLGEGFETEPRGPVDLKGKGTIESHFLVGRGTRRLD